MRKTILVTFPVLLAVLLVGCGGSSMPQQPAVGSTPVSLTIRDNPPIGVAVLSFEILVTQATLKPADPSIPDQQLIAAPVEIELEKLQTEAAFLNTTGVKPTKYNSITLAFANPEMTIFNGSPNTITAGGKSCPTSSTCELKPVLNAASVTFSQSPFPLDLNSGSPIGIVVDLDVQSSILTSMTNDLSVTPTVKLTTLPGVQGEGELEDIEELRGTVTAVDPMKKQFTLKEATTSQSFVITVNSQTMFELQGTTCTTNDITCIAVGQVLEVNLLVMPDGSFVAAQIELEGIQNAQESEGTVTSVGASSFTMVILDDEPGITNMAVGQSVTVTVNAQTAFDIDKDGLSIPSNLVFQSISDMIVGQEVEVEPAGAPMVDATTGAITVTAQRVRLQPSQITGTVNSLNAMNNNFTINGLNSLFTGASPAITEILVQASSATEFEGLVLPSVSSLSVGDSVSVRGPLFKAPAGASPLDPVLLAEKVRKR